MNKLKLFVLKLSIRFLEGLAWLLAPIGKILTNLVVSLLFGIDFIMGCLIGKHEWFSLGAAAILFGSWVYKHRRKFKGVWKIMNQDYFVIYARKDGGKQAYGYIYAEDTDVATSTWFITTAYQEKKQKDANVQETVKIINNISHEQ